jgi:hypothetical protein
MPFNSWQEAENRLGNPAPLTSEEIRDLFPHLNQISETGMRRLNAHLALKNLEAVQKFEQSSSRLTRWLIGLTFVLVVLTIVIACYTVVLARKESSPAESRQRFTHIWTAALGTYIMFDNKTAQACWAGPPGRYTLGSPDGKQRQETNDMNIPFCKDLKWWEKLRVFGVMFQRG